jgi:hypothetical protein
MASMHLGNRDQGGSQQLSPLRHFRRRMRGVEIDIRCRALNACVAIRMNMQASEARKCLPSGVIHGHGRVDWHHSISAPTGRFEKTYYGRAQVCVHANLTIEPSGARTAV